MRWTDLYLGLMATTFAFAGVVIRFDGAPWSAVIPVWILAAVLSIAMGLHARATRAILVVAEPREHPEPRLHDELDDAGFAVVSCVGPDARAGGCPVLAGRPCPFEGRHPVAAMVFAGTGDVEMLPPCGPALKVPAVALVEGSAEGVSFGVDDARIGWNLGPQDAALTLRALLSERRRDQASGR